MPLGAKRRATGLVRPDSTRFSWKPGFSVEACCTREMGGTWGPVAGPALSTPVPIGPQPASRVSRMLAALGVFVWLRFVTGVLWCFGRGARWSGMSLIRPLSD
jgi:hypothetical protein